MSDLEKLALPEIRELIVAGDGATLANTLERWELADVADLLIDLDLDEDLAALQVMTPQKAAEVFPYLPRGRQIDLQEKLPEPVLARLLNELPPDDRTALLEVLGREQAERLLVLLTPENQRISRGLLSFGEGTIGRLMTPEFVSIRPEWTVEEVLKHIRIVGRDSETLNALYVIDNESHLIDDIRIRRILLAEPQTIVRDLMDDSCITLNANDDSAETVELFRRYDRTVLPVVDGRNHLLGVVTIDDVMDVAQEATTREVQRFGGIEALDEPYVATPVLELVRKRGIWLIFLFLGEMLTASAMGFFENEIEKAVVLALFVPLIISSGGNSGSQAATLIVRAMAVGEIRLRDWWMVMRRELLSGLLLGVVLGTIGFGRIALWTVFTDMYGPHWLLVGLTVALSLVGIVLWGTLCGALLPFLIRRCGLDPATSSAPFVATLVDVTGLVIYFTVAMVILHGTLL